YPKPLRNEPLTDRRNLRRRPHLHHTILIDGRAVLRLERRVREKWIVIRGFDDLRAFGRPGRWRPGRELLRLPRHANAVLTDHSAFVPFHLEGLRRAERVPCRIGDDRDA